MISMLEKAMSFVEGLTQPYEDDATGTCLCNCNQPATFWVNYISTSIQDNLPQAVANTKDAYVDTLVASSTRF